MRIQEIYIIYRVYVVIRYINDNVQSIYSSMFIFHTSLYYKINNMMQVLYEKILSNGRCIFNVGRSTQNSKKKMSTKKVNYCIVLFLNNELKNNPSYFAFILQYVDYIYNKY